MSSSTASASTISTTSYITKTYLQVLLVTILFISTVTASSNVSQPSTPDYTSIEVTPPDDISSSELIIAICTAVPISVLVAMVVLKRQKLRTTSPRYQQHMLEPTASEFQELVNNVATRLSTHIESLSRQPAISDKGYSKAQSNLSSTSFQFPTKGRQMEEVLDDLFNKHAKVGINGSSPGFTAFVNGGGLPMSAVADLITQVLNKFTGVAAQAEAFVKLEVETIKMFCTMIGYKNEEAFGIYTSGGSAAHWSGIVAGISHMRKKYHAKLHKCTIYTSDQTHACVPKTARLCGIEEDHVRLIDSDAQGRIDLVKLAEKIQDDERNGLLPCIIAANAGTVYSGAVDDMKALSQLAARWNMWLHVDACYGGMFMLTEHGKQLMAGIELADSIALDLHKSFFLPFGTGLLLVKDVMMLKKTFAPYTHQSYLPESGEVDFKQLEFYNFSEMSVELSRPCRGLRAWLPIQIYGIEPFIECLNEKLTLARWLYNELEQLDGIQMVTSSPPSLTTMCFQAKGTGNITNEQMTRSLLNTLRGHNEKGENVVPERPKMFLYFPCSFKDKFCIRLCILHFRSHQEHISALRTEIAQALETVQAVNAQ